MKTKLIILAILAFSFNSIKSQAQEKPNIVIVFLDNFGYGEPGFNGGGILRGTETPRMDQLANEGLRLTNFNVEVQCTPSRSALLTGRYAIRSGNGTVPMGEGVYGLVQWEKTMAEMLSEAGYATGMFGKWHLGRTEGRFPTDQGFDEWYGVPNSTDESTYTSLDGFAESGVSPTYVMEGKKGISPEKVKIYDLDYRPLIDRDLTDKAKDFMERKSKENKPFFLYLPYTATHFPTMPHPDFKGKTSNGPWADLLLQIDSYTGELVDKIEELGETDNTLFIFTADNGPEALDFNSTSLTVETAAHGSPGPWRGTLFTGFEGALRVPFVAKWPGKIDAGKSSDEIVHAMDLFPTIGKIAGGTVPQDRIIDGIEMSDFFLGNKTESGRDGFVVYMGNDIFGVKWKNWKLHFKEQNSWNSVLNNYTMPKLYNLYTDPQEKDNVLFPHTWVPKAALGQLTEHVISLKQNPPIKAGQKDPYQPKN
ncbi:MAG: arylsulfatase [Bacteroidetes bacterium MedPE-SWsnd-G1]|nr:MAG: arylsulfatase [Bacteroidetes bacterium MedPE-SWsnd-G1]